MSEYKMADIHRSVDSIEEHVSYLAARLGSVCCQLMGPGETAPSGQVDEAASSALEYVMNRLDAIRRVTASLDVEVHRLERMMEPEPDGAGSQQATSLGSTIGR